MIQDSTIELEKMDIPYHGMDQIIFIADDNDEYLKWYSEDNTAVGFQFNRGALKDTFVYILRDSIKISENGVTFNHKVIRNPHNVPDSVFESKPSDKISPFTLNSESDIIDICKSNLNKLHDYSIKMKINIDLISDEEFHIAYFLKAIDSYLNGEESSYLIL